MREGGRENGWGRAERERGGREESERGRGNSGEESERGRGKSGEKSKRGRGKVKESEKGWEERVRGRADERRNKGERKRR